MATPSRGRRPAQNRSGNKRGAQARPASKNHQGKPAKAKSVRNAPAPPEGPQLPPYLRLGAVPGATPGKWIGIWRERTPQTELELVHVSVSDQRAALLEQRVDIALVRQPIDRDSLHVIPLYDELPVVVFSVESHLAAAEPTAELLLDDLAGETLFVPADDTLDVRGIGATVAPAYDGAMSAEDVIATVATGAGITIVPMSIARALHRKDVEHRVLKDGPVSPVALAWVADLTSPAIDRFVGIVRGRTVNSSRD